MPQRSINSFFAAPKGAAKPPQAAPDNAAASGSEPAAKKQKRAEPSESQVNPNATNGTPKASPLLGSPAPKSPGAATPPAERTSATPSPAKPKAATRQPTLTGLPAPKPVTGPKPKAVKGGVGKASVDAARLQSKYDPMEPITWNVGDPVPYKVLADTFKSIEEESSRIECSAHLTRLFRSILAAAGGTAADGGPPETDSTDLRAAAYLTLGKVAPSYQSLELGLGPAICNKALASAVGTTPEAIKAAISDMGDIGKVANAKCKSQGSLKGFFGAGCAAAAGAPKHLTIRGVFNSFLSIAKESGSKSQDRKVATIKSLLRESRPPEACFIMRGLTGKMRMGLAGSTVLVALAHSLHLHQFGAAGSPEELAGDLAASEAVVKQAFSECPDMGVLIDAALAHGIGALADNCSFRVGMPVHPMLAKSTTSIQEVIDKFEGIAFTCEYKYDGERAQVHVDEQGTVTIYSRNSENNTAKYPEISAHMKGFLADGVKSVVLDCEAVAFDREKSRILPFQQLQNRPRKNAKIEDLKVLCNLYVFDCLLLNGESLLKKSLTDRRAAMASAIREKPGHCELATVKDSNNVEELELFLNESVAACTEGLIVKTLDATYEPSKRSQNWLKLKKDYLDGGGDSFDLVVVGAFHGQGKRCGVFGSYVLACYDEDGEQFQTITKIGTGFSEAVLQELFVTLKDMVVDSPPSNYSFADTLTPDVWFDAKVVWEVKAADITISPTYTAAFGLVDAGKGISIRFPRLIRQRDDKDPEQATSAVQVADMYRAQSDNHNKRPKADSEDDLL